MDVSTWEKGLFSNAHVSLPPPHHHSVRAYDDYENSFRDVKEHYIANLNQMANHMSEQYDLEDENPPLHGTRGKRMRVSWG